MTTLYGISFVGHAVFECHIFLLKCFNDFFSFYFGYFPLSFYTHSPLPHKKIGGNKEKPKPQQAANTKCKMLLHRIATRALSLADLCIHSMYVVP